ncbi:hypothetical protein [Paenibacillus caseinilyticus]|uniref:hypothetical protein n=1 Tax=Paenibacillus caseinilyticus TaxID=3098138 RepID=UPI0022B87122|nr:hypothetical protein [Paenibacillus caseinilyticus]MCZ8520826.1 hypothetical protein [Paenibacillus caseinilyticus]
MRPAVGGPCASRSASSAAAAGSPGRQSCSSRRSRSRRHSSGAAGCCVPGGGCWPRAPCGRAGSPEAAIQPAEADTVRRKDASAAGARCDQTAGAGDQSTQGLSVPPSMCPSSCT